ncbi:MAG: tetratricopeptide repeat protein [Candidatus Rokubacteria bacterium]|nr:tetratricopeptide repeat protein [Candidatus Rokubacteria bacterium]MBI3107105.1 tetratricopeptide repeat protein [Candidatus Rokubacteria bacterium]
MSRIKEVKRQLEAVSQAIESLDADFAAGRLGADEHGRQRAERERQAGQLYLGLRRTQREVQGARAEPAAAPALRHPGWLRSPVAIAVASVLLVVVGVGAGLTVGGWLDGKRGAGAPAGVLSTAPAVDPSAMMTEIELQALRQVAAREDAPIPSLLQLAHGALDKGRLDEARQVYQRILTREPRNVEAITHMGGVLFQEGRVDEALGKVEEALRIDSRYIHAHWDRTQYLFYAKRDYPAAVKAAEAFLGIVPDGPDADNMRKLIAEAKRQGTR